MIRSDYLISVIVPVYNVEKYIEECLESLSNQDDANFEVIIVNDGSTDRSIHFAKKFFNRIKNIRIVHQENRGLGGARNKGIDQASGEFIVFVDSDDILSHDFLRLLREEQKRGNYDIVCGSFQKITEKGKRILNAKNKKNPESFDLSYYQKVLGLFESSVAWAKLIRKDFLLQYNIRFLKRIPHEDWFFTYKALMLSNSSSVIEDKVYFWRQREGSLGKSVSLNHIKILPHLRLDTITFLKKYKADHIDYELAARRILVVINVFRNKIKVSGGELLNEFLKLISENLSNVIFDLQVFTKSRFHDPNITRNIRSLLEEVKAYKQGRVDLKKDCDTRDLNLSIISPSYNQTSYVQSMIESVAGQTITPFEHIILDANSSDGTLIKLKSYENSNSHVTLHVGRDISQTNAINLGFHESRGDILTWLNTDDKYYSNDVLEKVLLVFAENPEVDVVYGRGNFVDLQGSFIREAYINRDPVQLKTRFCHSVGILQPALFFRRSVFEQIGPLDESLNYCFDYEYWIRMAHNDMKFYFLDHIVCEAVLHQDSKTIGQRKEQLQETIDVARKYYDFVSLEWLNKVADNMITGADGIIKNTNQKSNNHKSKLKELFLTYNSNAKAVSAIWSLSPHKDIKSTLEMLNSTWERYNLYVATCLDSDCFQKGLTLIAQLQKNTDLKFATLIYNLGLSTDEINILSDLHDVFIINLPLNNAKFPDQYFSSHAHGYRAYIPWHVEKILPNKSTLMFIDANVVPVRNFHDLINIIEKQDVFLIKAKARLNVNDQLVFPHISDECIKLIEASNKELFAPLLNVDLFGYKTGGKYKHLFADLFDYSLNSSTNNNDEKNHHNIPSKSSLSELRKKVLNDHSLFTKFDFHTIREAFGFSGNNCFQPMLSVLASRYNIPISEDASVFAVSSLVKNNLLNTTNKNPVDYLPEFDLNDPSITERTFFFKHYGHFLNHHGLKFNLKRKKRAIIMGNGPSLRGFDFNRLNDFDVFGMNAAYRHWDKINWYPQYFSCLDVVVGLSHANEIKRLVDNAHNYGIKKFLLLDNLIKELNISQNHDRIISFEKLKEGSELLSAPSVTTGSHTAAWAAYLGYEEIYLIGVDSNYIEVIEGAKQVKGAVLQMETTPEKNPNYFFDDYQQKGDVYHIPNPTRPVHLQGWREIAGRLLSTNSRVLNANPLSKVDAFDICHFNEIETGKPIDVIPRERALINNFIINSLEKSVSDPQKRVVLLTGKTDGFNLKPFTASCWHILYVSADQKPMENIWQRYKLDFREHQICDNDINLGLVVDSVINERVYKFIDPIQENKSDINCNCKEDKIYDATQVSYLYFGPQSAISVTKRSLKAIKPEVAEVYLEESSCFQLYENTLNYIDQFEAIGYSTSLLFKLSDHNEDDGYIFTSKVEDLPKKISACCIYATRTPLNLESLRIHFSNLDIKQLYLNQKYGFVYESVFKTGGVIESNGSFNLKPPPGKNYIAYRYAGRVIPKDKIVATISFASRSSCEFKVMLCRDGSTPFEYSDKKIHIEQGEHTIKLEHTFIKGHKGLRIQMGSVSGATEISNVYTKIFVNRNGKSREVDLRHKESKLLKDNNKTITEIPPSFTNRVYGIANHKLYSFYRRSVEFLLPEATRRRYYAGLIKKNTVLFFLWIKSLFR